MELIFFSIFSAILLIAAVAVVTLRNPVKSAYILVLCYFASSVCWVLLDAAFLAFALLMIYVGAVMVLFLFIIMMLRLSVTKSKESFVRFYPLVGLLGVSFVSALGYLIYRHQNSVTVLRETELLHLDFMTMSNVLFTEYLYPFEVAGVILLAAMVIVITINPQITSKWKSASTTKQTRADRRARVKLVDMNDAQFVDDSQLPKQQ